MSTLAYKEDVYSKKEAEEMARSIAMEEVNKVMQTTVGHNHDNVNSKNILKINSWYNDLGTSENNNISIQRGWGYLQGNGTAVVTEAVTFPKEFADEPIVMHQIIWLKSTASGAPTSPGSFATAPSSNNTVITSIATGITSTGYSQSLRISAGTFSSSFNYGYMWVAVGKSK